MGIICRSKLVISIGFKEMTSPWSYHPTKFPMNWESLMWQTLARRKVHTCERYILFFLNSLWDKATIHGTFKMPALQKFLTEFIRLNLIIKVPQNWGCNPMSGWKLYMRAILKVILNLDLNFILNPWFHPQLLLIFKVGLKAAWNTENWVPNTISCKRIENFLE